MCAFTVFCKKYRGIRVVEEWELGTELVLHLDEDNEFVFAFNPAAWKLNERIDPAHIDELPVKNSLIVCCLAYGNDFGEELRTLEQAVTFARYAFSPHPESCEVVFYETPRLISCL